MLLRVHSQLLFAQDRRHNKTASPISGFVSSQCGTRIGAPRRQTRPRAGYSMRAAPVKTQTQILESFDATVSLRGNVVDDLKAHGGSRYKN
jgi:hypothetical protein